MKTMVLRLSALAAGVALTTGIGGSALAQKPVGDQPVKPFFNWSLAEQKTRFPALEKTYQTASVRKGERVRELPVASAQIQPKLAIAGRQSDLAAFMAANNIEGVIALKDGKIVLEKFLDGRKPEDRWASTGLAQAMTSTLIGAAIKDGWIKSEFDLAQLFFPELRGTAYEDVSLRRLMSMSSGVKWNNSHIDGNSDEMKLATAAYKPGAANPAIALAAGLKREAEPGQKHVEKSIDADLAGLALARALAGRTLAQYASEKIWAPYGMEQDAAWAVDAAGQEKASGPLSMTLRDAARFGQFLLDGGKIDDRQVLPEDWVEKAARNQLNAGAPGAAGFFFSPNPDGSFEANGLFGQGFYVNPKERLVVVINAAAVHADDILQDEARRALLNAIRQEFRNGHGT